MEGEIFVISAIRDITERKRAEEALRASEERFAKAFQASPVAISITTLAEGRFLNVNDYFLDLMGYCQEEVIGHTSLELGVWPQPEFRDKVAQALRQQQSIRSMEIPFRAKSGEIIQTLASMEPIDWAGERCIFCMTQDITKRKQAESRQVQLVHELESVNRELNDFAYVVSHDLKAPLRAIGSLADWIATDYAEQLGEEGQEQLNLLMGRVKRMHTLIDGVLLYSRLGRNREERLEVNLNNLMAEVIDLLDPPPSITVKIENSLPVVVGEKTRLQQLFQNLLNNAIKFMDKPQGQISVSHLEQADFWQFCVADNGPGIEAKHFAKIFQLFQTLSPRDEFESTGVGLALVKKIVELHGGKVWVESKVGEGSAFFFTLPK
jgi:PAS domain S-box-containing protein